MPFRMDYIASTLFILFIFILLSIKHQFLIVCITIRRNFVPVCTFLVFGVFLSTFASLCCCYSNSHSIFHIAQKEPYQMNAIPVRIDVDRHNKQKHRKRGREKKKREQQSSFELTGFYYFSFWQYADEIWCMLTYLRCKEQGQIKMPLLAFNLQNNKMGK